MPDRASLAAFAGFVVIGGFNFVAVRFSNRELPPLFGAGIRFAAAALLLIAVVAVRRISIPRGKAFLGAVLYGLFAFTLAYAFAYIALTRLPAGIGAVVFASTPLFTVLLAPIHRIEAFRMRALIGALISLVGIAILANPGAAESLSPLHLLAMLGSAAAAAESAVVLKKLPAANPLSTNAVAMGIGGLLLLLVSLVAAETWAWPAKAETWTAVSYLAVIGSVGLFGLFLFVLRRWSASATSFSTALIPVVSFIAGALLASEAVTLTMVTGALIVLVGVYLGALAGTAAEPAEPAPAVS
ncbi:MAG: DMT family transporter [Actinomycetota bacterium]